MGVASEPVVKTSKIYVLYHDECMDGKGAHYVANKKFGDSATYIAVNYGKPIPEIEDGSEVYILDFAYDRATLEALNARVAKLVVLDHHKTHRDELAGLSYAIFDMDRSGAMLAWNYFFPDEPAPKIITRVQDRDLWKWQYRDTKDVLNTLSSADGDFNVWEWAEKNFEKAVENGRAVSEYQEWRVKLACQESKLRFTTFRGLKVVVCNNDSYGSEIGSQLVQMYPEVDCYIGVKINPDGRVYCSLRSRKDFDCSVLAKQLGGGGHAQASGAITPFSVLAELYQPS